LKWWRFTFLFFLGGFCHKKSKLHELIIVLKAFFSLSSPADRPPAHWDLPFGWCLFWNSTL
jgi:hypothetical protein